MNVTDGLARMTAEEAAEHIFDGATVAFSGFTPAGAAKAVPRAMAKRAEQARDSGGQPLRWRVLTGASTGHSLDEALAKADAIAWRAPYQSSKELRAKINSQAAEFLDMHLSHVPQMIEFGFLGKIDFAVVEAVDVTADGRIYLSTSVGISPSALRNADKIIVELNHYHADRLAEMHDITVLPTPPLREPIPIHTPMTKIGQPFVAVDKSKILAVVPTDEPDEMHSFTEPDAVSQKIADHTVRFLLDEMHVGRIPKGFLPVQSGVGNIANAMLAGLNANEEVPPFYMFTEVLQDSVVDLMYSGKCLGASCTSLTVSPPQLQRMYDDMDFFAPKVVLRPQELTNNPGLVRRLGVISTNTALEIDIYGCVNSTHVCGTMLMNGVGGSGDFTRNAYLSIFMAPSVAKRGKISAIVPMCSHVDHNEHSVQIVVTEQGLADLRGLGPIERARTIIDKCAHPDYKPYLQKYLAEAPMGHIRHDLAKAFELHLNFLQHGEMLPG